MLSWYEYEEINREKYNREVRFCKFASKFNYKSRGKFLCLLTTTRKNQNAKNVLNNRAQNIAKVLLRKTAAIIKTIGKVQFQ